MQLQQVIVKNTPANPFKLGNETQTHRVDYLAAGMLTKYNIQLSGQMYP